MLRSVLMCYWCLVVVTAVATKYYVPVELCSWLPGKNDVFGTRLQVMCNVGTLDTIMTNQLQLITNIPPKATSKLQIHCSDSFIYKSVLPKVSFLQRLQVLQELIISNCKLLEVQANTFEGLHTMKSLSINTNNADWGADKILDLDGLSFSGLRELQSLHLGNNNIRVLPKGVFCPLPNLQILNITRNRIQVSERLGFGEASSRLAACSNNLQVLDLSHNELRALSETVVFADLHHLQQLYLQYNYISDIGNTTLRGLVSLRQLNLANNKLEVLPKELFSNSKDLRELYLQNNSLHSLEQGLFHHLQQLLVLDLSANQLTSGHIDAGTFTGLIRLIVLNLSHNALTHIDASILKDLHFLQSLDLRNNSIRFIEDNAILSLYSLHTNKLLAPVSANRSVPELYLGGNPFHCDCTLEWLQRISNVTAMRQYPKVMDIENVMCHVNHSRAMPNNMPLVLAKSSDFLCTYETHCFTWCHCCDFDACDCEMTCPNNCLCYHDQTWNTNVVDCSSQDATEIPHQIPMYATEVYLDGNSFKELRSHMFIGRKNMRVLYVNNSEVHTIENRAFNGLDALEILHLEENKIRELKGYEFEHFAHLKKLYLHNNIIVFISNSTFSPLRSLEILRLDGNKLVSFPIWQLNAPRLRELTLGNNEWSCRCTFLQELTAWVNDNAAKVIDSSNMQCYNNDSSPPGRRELDFKSTNCSDYYAGGSAIESMLVPTVIITLCLVLLMVFALALLFVFRNPLRGWLYSRCGGRLCSFCVSANKHFEDRDKLYDSFVCYSLLDEEWVEQSLASELDGFQLCLQYRDLPHTAYLQRTALAVREAAEASRWIIIVLTLDYLHTEWTRIALRQVLHEALKGRVSKLIILGEAPEAEQDPELRAYLNTGQRVRWGEKEFWEKLRYVWHAVCT